MASTSWPTTLTEIDDGDSNHPSCRVCFQKLGNDALEFLPRGNLHPVQRPEFRVAAYPFEGSDDGGRGLALERLCVGEPRGEVDD